MSGTFLGTGLGGGFFPAAAAASPIVDPTAAVYAAEDYVIGGYHDFDGVDDNITFGSIAAAQLQPSDTFTLSMWVKLTGSSGTKTILANHSGGNQTDADGWLYYQAGSLVRLAFLESGTTTVRAETPLIATTAGAWVHHFVVWDNGTLKAWSNGASVGLTTPLTGSVTPTYASAEVTIGGDKDGFLSYASANIAEVAIWTGDQSALVGGVYNLRKRHNLMDLSTPPDVFYAPLTSYGDNPDGTAGAVFEAVSGNDGTGVNMDAVDAIQGDGGRYVVSGRMLDVNTSTVTDVTSIDLTLYDDGAAASSGTGGSFP